MIDAARSGARWPIAPMDTFYRARLLEGRSRNDRCNFPNCPRASIYEATDRDYRVVLAEDAVSGLYDKGRDELSNIGVRLMSTTAVVRALRAPLA
jgi:hypothetical protein